MALYAFEMLLYMRLWIIYCTWELALEDRAKVIIYASRRLMVNDILAIDRKVKHL
jgi:hypothetical protein